MKHLSIYLLNGLFMCPFLMQAQVTPQKQRMILSHVYDVLDGYEQNMFAEDEYQVQKFKGLFVSDHVTVFNDLLGFYATESLSLKDYVATLNRMVKNATIRLKNIRYDEIEDQGDHYLVKLTMDKSLSYSDPDGILFSNEDYFGKDYQLVLDMKVNKSNYDCKIAKISGRMDSDKPLLEQGTYVVLNKTSPLDTEVKCNGNLLTFNSFDQAILPTDYMFTYGDPDMRVKVNKPHSESRLISLNYKQKSWNIMPYYEMSLMDVYDIGDSSDMIENKSSMQEAGLKFRYVFPRKSNVKWGLSWGVGYSKSTIDLNVAETSYNYRTSYGYADVDGDIYDRYYNISNIQQSVELSQVVVPLAVNMEWKIGKRFSFDFEAGVKGYMTLSSEITDFSLDQDVYGKYPNYGDLILDGSWGLNNFGKSTLGLNNLYDVDVDASTFMVDAFGGLGMSLKLFGPLSISAGVKYQYGILKAFKENNNAVVLSNGQRVEENQALVTYTTSFGDQTNGLMGCLKDVKRSGLLFNVGLNFKF